MIANGALCSVIYLQTYFHSTVKGILCKSVIKTVVRQKIYQKYSSGILFIPLKKLLCPRVSFMCMLHGQTKNRLIGISYCLWFYTPMLE